MGHRQSRTWCRRCEGLGQSPWGCTERPSLKGHHRCPQEGDSPLCCTLSCPLLPWQVTCKAAITFFQYSVLANFYWLLVEGLYLQTLLLLTFTCDRSYTWGYVLMGWGEPGDIPGIPGRNHLGTT